MNLILAAEALNLKSCKNRPAATLIGTEGALLSILGRSAILLLEKKFENHSRPKFEPLDHYHQFVGACLGLTQAASHFAQTGPMTESILLGTVACRQPERKLEWSHPGMEFKNDSNANKLLKRSYRAGWQVGRILIAVPPRHESKSLLESLETACRFFHGRE